MFSSLLLLSFVPLISCLGIAFKDCGGSEEYIKIESIDIQPYPIKYPGSVAFTPVFDVLKDIPNDDGVKLSVSLDKLTPKRMRIPCINGFGSCTVDYCKDYEKNPILNQFGFGKCPMTKGKYQSPHPSTPMPDFGSIFNKIMEGDFEANVTLYNGNQVYSCHQFKLTIVLS